MIRLLAMVVGGLTLFMGLAIPQHWEEVFAPYFAGEGRPRAPGLSDEDRQEAEKTVRELLNGMIHLHIMGPDPRLVERVPASEALLGELLDDVRYTWKNQRRQRMNLVRLEVQGVERLADDVLEVRTKEYWVIRVTVPGGGNAAQGEIHSGVQHASYRLRRQSVGWRVEGWDPEEPPAPPEAPGT